jgi:hypothetical protein
MQVHHREGPQREGDGGSGADRWKVARAESCLELEVVRKAPDRRALLVTRDLEQYYKLRTRPCNELLYCVVVDMSCIMHGK